MEDILNNIHNIDDTHVSDHHLHDVEYHRTDPFNQKKLMRPPEHHTSIE